MIFFELFFFAFPVLLSFSPLSASCGVRSLGKSGRKARGKVTKK